MLGHRPWRVALVVAVFACPSDPASASTQLLSLSSPRSPQVHVGGSGLRGYFDSVGELIDPTRDQVAGELVASGPSINPTTFSIQVEVCRHSDPTAIGIYDGYRASPTLMEVFPSNAGPGWFAVVSYRTSPTRVIVSLFDDIAAFVSSRTYLGADRNGVGFYLSGPSGVVYSQDARNPGGASKVLFYKGTGLNSGSAWIGAETADADDDFDDTVLVLEAFLGSNSNVTTVRHATWGDLKARFR